jgi:hypothetical protein
MQRWIVLGAVLLGVAGCSSSGSSSTDTGPGSGTTQQPATASADNPGDPNAPCSVTFTLGRGVLSLSIDTQKRGELVIEPAVNGTGSHAHILRRDIQHLHPGTINVKFSRIQSVDQIPVVLYTSPSFPHGCSVVRQGDPAP